MEIWDAIVPTINRFKESDERSVFHPTISDIFRRDLHWPAKCIINELQIQMGREKKRCDIVLCGDSHKPMVAIEIKKANAPEQEIDIVSQLRSYVRNTSPQMEIGILIKDKIYIFYDEREELFSTLNDAVIEIPFERGHAEGEKFVELFYFDNFNLNVIIEYCKSKREQKLIEKKKEKSIAELTAILLSENGIMHIKNALITYLSQSNYSEDVINEAINRLSFQISPNRIESSIKQQPHKHRVKSEFARKSTNTMWTFIPSVEGFIENFYDKGGGWIHWRMDDDIISHSWNNKNNSITKTNIRGNITSRPFWRENKNRISEIIVSIYSDPTIGK